MSGGLTEHHADGPSVAGSVVLEIGRGIGALVLYAPAAMDGAEIEISRPQDAAVRRTHSRVRLRLGRAGGESGGLADAGRSGRPGDPGSGQARYAAVYPGLPAGTYTIWRDADTPAGTAVVRGGEVASWQWPPDLS